ncbi:hypothetical protein [Maribellus luteus]|nr:hypothetical protein [Maribellus luteus]
MSALSSFIFQRWGVLILLSLFTISTISCDSPKPAEPVLIGKALPVWAKGRETEKNLNLGFHGVFRAENGQDVKLKITGSTLYRVFLNGEFLGYGPARTAQGFFRVDEYELKDRLKSGANIVAVEVAGYNVNSYYTMDQPSFLQAEVVAGDDVLLATGEDAGFSAFVLKERLQKAERYSFQRPFTEYYRLDENSRAWRSSEAEPAETLELAVQAGGELLPRNLLLPDFDVVRPQAIYSKGTLSKQVPEGYGKDRSLTNISDILKGFPEDKLETIPSLWLQEIVTVSHEIISEPYSGASFPVSENSFVTCDFGTNLSGFIGGKVSCSEPSKLVFFFDEILTDGDVQPKKRSGSVNNYVVYELEPGTYNLESFESYTFKFLKIMVLQGACKFNDVHLREYAYPEHSLASFESDNTKLNAIYEAAEQTFRQNSVDIFMDCPSRERAGWLCDSYFMAIMEKGFTGKSAIAYNYYENFALPDSFAFLPDGMLPMCFPADHNDGVFIPNWAMWFIVQVEDYASRGGDPELIAKLEPRVSKLLDYFVQFENEDGLLEKLQSWIFVEWSKANDFVQDVNYPTNMLYSAALEKAGKLYQNTTWAEKADKVKQTILKQSFNGSFFVDNAVREADGKLQVTTNTTEACQYYAFFFNIATPETHPELWKKLTTDFGPKRDDKVTYPDVFRANAFIGNYLRMDILSRYGLQKQMLGEIQDYFYYMAEQTGTLWENTGSYASCNHGFASYLGHVLYRDVLGISSVDYLKKEVTIRFADLDLNKCSGVMPVEDEAIELKWERFGNQLNYSVKVPTGFKVNIENLSSLELNKVN